MTALFVIDVQKEYMDKYENSLLFRINERIDDANENNQLIIYVKNVRKLRSGMTTYEFAEGLNICSPYVVYKEKSSVFSDTGLTDILDKNNVSEIEVIGIDGNCCVASSAADAAKAGYGVVLPCKYIGVQNLERFEKKKKALIKQGIMVVS